MGTADGSDFEGGLGGWNAGTQASAVATSTDQAHKGTQSLKITRNATASGYLAVSNSAFPVGASTNYYFQAWIYTSVAAGVIRFDFDYYQANGTTYISSFTSAVPDTALMQNDWTRCGPISFTTPTLTGFVRTIPVSVSGFSNANTLYLDDLFMGRLLVPRGQLVMPQALTRTSTR
ncbi:carbohydrate binding domain-containing protein [Streptomyces sp. NPDC059009]|uniref:carbohydrate binding domain-containing protein n=1 Tax=Streptomyces sp. NPDC059009 TaxID=3346694 RepID=UPI0036914A58